MIPQATVGKERYFIWKQAISYVECGHACLTRRISKHCNALVIEPIHPELLGRKHMWAPKLKE